MLSSRCFHSYFAFLQGFSLLFSLSLHVCISDFIFFLLIHNTFEWCTLLVATKILIPFFRECTIYRRVRWFYVQFWLYFPSFISTCWLRSFLSFQVLTYCLISLRFFVSVFVSPLFLPIFVIFMVIFRKRHISLQVSLWFFLTCTVWLTHCLFYICLRHFLLRHSFVVFPHIPCFIMAFVAYCANDFPIFFSHSRINLYFFPLKWRVTELITWYSVSRILFLVTTAGFAACKSLN